MVSNKLKYILASVGLLLISIGACFQYMNQKDLLIEAKEAYSGFFNKKNELNEDLNIKIVTSLQQQIKTIKIFGSKKKKLQTSIEELKKYILLKDELDILYADKTFADVSLEKINKLEKKYNKLNKFYQNYLKEKITVMRNQKEFFENIELEISKLFVNNSKTILNDDVTEEQIESIRKKLSNLEKIEFVENKNNDLDIAIKLINKKDEEIRNAWVFLNIPYINQNDNKVYNGCEAACLLMGLQYKEYLKETTLQQIATDIPKSNTNNAYEGFTHDIFGLEPRDIPHWIAPNALATFGRTYSGNLNIVDATGYSLDDLNSEIENNNPVIIYATANFVSPKNWKEGAPQNLHVVLLTGYNKITKEQIVTDPGGKTDGGKIKFISKNQLEKIYNAVGKKAVIIR